MLLKLQGSKRQFNFLISQLKSYDLYYIKTESQFKKSANYIWIFLKFIFIRFKNLMCEILSHLYLISEKFLSKMLKCVKNNTDTEERYKEPFNKLRVSFLNLNTYTTFAVQYSLLEILPTLWITLIIISRTF